MEYDSTGKKVKSLNPNITDRQLAQQGAQTVNFCSWERLKPYLAMAAGGNADVQGIKLTEQGLEIIVK